MKKTSLKPVLTFGVLTALLSACANPTSLIQPDIDQFKREYPNHIQSFQAKNRTLRFAWSGDPSKRAILFIHGSPGSWEAWAHFLLNPELQKDFHLIAIDRPGYGGSGAGKAETSLEVQANEILEVLSFNESKLPAILVGHSFGGPVIARAAMDHPNQIGGLIFVASSVSPELESTKWIQYPAQWWPISALIPNKLRVCNEEILPLKEELTAMLPLWSKIAAPSVLIQGEKDDLVPPGNLDFLITHLTSAKIIKISKISDLNHFVPWLRPDLILDAIQNLKLSLLQKASLTHEVH